jgi:hypothetical protein
MTPLPVRSDISCPKLMAVKLHLIPILRDNGFMKQESSTTAANEVWGCEEQVEGVKVWALEIIIMFVSLHPREEQKIKFTGIVDQ